MRAIRAVLRLLQLVALSAAFAASAAAQNCGWSRIDHRVTYDESGVWNPNVYRGISAVTANLSKYAFTRVRPSNTDNPCLWFQGGSNYSFPSGEAATAAGLVTPYVLEYGSEHPAAYGLLLLPLYVGAGRIKNQAHWQSDVLAGWAIGGLSGWYAHSRDVPILVEILPHGAAVGWHTQF
jgi:membrane-associated phospholipid phosphatase